MNDDAVRAFAVFARHLNFTRAAEELRVSQPALHVKIRKLAADLGHDLYRRHGRTLRLTAQGEALSRYAADAEARRGEFLARLGAPAPELPVVLAAGAGAYLYVIADAMREALKRHRLRLLTTARDPALAAVRTGRAHLAVTVLDVVPDDLATVRLATYPQVLVMPARHRLARRRQVTLADLDGLDLVVPPPQRPHRIALERAVRGAGLPWRGTVEAEGWALMLHFVKLGLGLAVVNGCVQPLPGLVTRPISDLAPVPYYAVHRPEAVTDPRVESLLRLLQAARSEPGPGPTPAA